MADRIWDSVLVPSSEQWGLKGTARTGGQSFSGAEQLVESPTARVTASLTIPCNTREKVLAARRVIALGRSQVWVLGPIEVRRAPWAVDPLTGGKITYARQDGGAATPYDRASDFVLASAALLNTTTITVTRRAGGHVLPGQFLSIGNRLHTIVDLLSGDPTEAGSGLAIPGNITLSIRPWTRADYAAGAAVEFGRPVCRMRLASDDTGDLALQLSRMGSATFDFVEAT
jgi:hypothetical protein